MAKCLAAQYDFVMTILVEYGMFATTIQMRARRRTAFRILVKSDEFENQIKIWMAKHVYFIPFRPFRAEIDRYIKDEERKDPFCDVILSEFPLESLAKHIEALEPNVDFARVARLFEVRDKRLWWTNPKVVVTGVLGVGIFVLNLVPDTVGAAIDANFDVAVFSMTLGFAVSTGGLWVLYWWLVGRLRRLIRRNVRDALDYLAIRAEGARVQK